MKEFVRYFCVVAFGLAIDVGIAWVLSFCFGLPLILCASVGFLSGVAVNYLLFEHWVFRTKSYSWRRLGKAYLAAQTAFIVRLGAVWLLPRLVPDDIASREFLDFATLVIAAGASFLINFLIVRLVLKERKS